MARPKRFELLTPRFVVWSFAGRTPARPRVPNSIVSWSRPHNRARAPLRLDTMRAARSPLFEAGEAREGWRHPR